MFDKNLLKLPGMHGVLAALVVLALLQAGFIIAQAYGLSATICALIQGDGIDEALPSLALCATSFGMLQLLRFFQDCLLDRYSTKQAHSLQGKLLERVFDPGVLLAQSAGADHVANVATAQMDDVQTYLRIIPPKIVGMAAITLPVLVAVFAIDWPSGVILAIMFPVIMFFMVLLGKQAREQAARQYGAYTRLTTRFMDTLRGLAVIRAFRASRSEAQAVFGQSEKLRRATVRTLRTATLSSAVLDLCATFGVAAVAMMLAFRLLDGSLLLFTGLITLVLAPEYFSPIRSFASDYHASLDGKNALAEVFSLIDDNEPGTRGFDTPGCDWTETSILELAGVSYLYDETRSGIPPISFTLSGFEKVCVIGRSGAGKSTLSNIVAGFSAPSSGSVKVNGMETDLTNDSWKRQVRYIPQHPYVFRAPLIDNIRFYRPDAAPEDVMRAVRAVGLEPLVESLPSGLSTLVGEGARGLSGGEAHRVALARILLDEDARILVFDEPTAHLDIETERELKEPMLKAMQGKLVVFATHRLHWIQDMDRVVDLDSLEASQAEVA